MKVSEDTIAEEEALNPPAIPSIEEMQAKHDEAIEKHDEAIEKHEEIKAEVKAKLGIDMYTIVTPGKLPRSLKKRPIKGKN